MGNLTWAWYAMDGRDYREVTGFSSSVEAFESFRKEFAGKTFPEECWMGPLEQWVAPGTVRFLVQGGAA